MPSCFLVLQRFFLRVDDVLFRINDTRLYHEFGKDYFVREYTSKDAHYNTIRQVIRLYVLFITSYLFNYRNWVEETYHC
jgi:type 2A phosphatase activator TIP41